MSSSLFICRARSESSICFSPLLPARASRHQICPRGGAAAATAAVIATWLLAAGWFFAPPTRAAATTGPAQPISTETLSTPQSPPTPETSETPPPMYTPPAPHEVQIAAPVNPDRLLNDVHQLVAAGNRFGGSRSNQASALYIAKELLALGLDIQLVYDDPAVWTYDQGPYSLQWASPQGADTADRSLQFAAAHPYSFATNPDQPVVDIEADVVYVQAGDKAEAYEKAGATGKIVLMDGSPRRNYKLARAAGAVAILTDYPNNPKMYTDSAMLSSLPPNDPEKLPVMALSYTEGQALKAKLAAGTPVRLHLSVEQHIYQARPVTVLARLQPVAGAFADRFFLVTAHADGDSGGPSADDNASGIAAVLELARTLKAAEQQGLWQPTFGVEFALFGKEYHGAGAWLARHASQLPNLLGVINYDEVGTGASRDAIFFESPDVPYNELLLRTFDSVGRDYMGKPGFWKEYATDDSLGGTDSYAFLATWTARGNGRCDGPYQIPATTLFTAAWNEADVIPPVPFWPNKGLAAGEPVVVDYSAYYHSSRDLPETTTDREPQNLVNAVRATALTLARLNHLFSQPTPFADDEQARFDPNRLYAEALYRAGLWTPLDTRTPTGNITPSSPATAAASTATAAQKPLAALGQVPTVGEIEQVASRLARAATASATTTASPDPALTALPADPAPLTRLRFVEVLARHAAVTLPDEAATAAVLKQASLADADEIEPADRPVVAIAWQKGWLLPQYDADGEPLFAPNAALNRGEALKRLVWVLGIRLPAQP